MRSIESMVSDLPRDERQCFTLLKVYSYTGDEIAKRLNMPLSEVEQHLADATRRISREIEAK